MEDEIACMAAVIGASLAGAKALTATSGPGFSLMQENIGYAVMAEVPCVIVNVMRGGPSHRPAHRPAQGDVMQARWGTHGDHPIIALAPSSVGVLRPHRRGLQPRRAATAPRSSCSRTRWSGHMREAVELPHVGGVRIAERGEPDCDPEEYDTVVSTIDHILPRPRLGSRFRCT